MLDYTITASSSNPHLISISKYNAIPLIHVISFYVYCKIFIFFFFFSSRRRHTRWNCDWSSDVCSSDLTTGRRARARASRAGPSSASRGRGRRDAGRSPPTRTRSPRPPVAPARGRADGGRGAPRWSLARRSSPRAHTARRAPRASTRRAAGAPRVRGERPSASLQHIRVYARSLSRMAPTPGDRLPRVGEAASRYRKSMAISHLRPDHEVVVIGGGFSGIGAA